MTNKELEDRIDRLTREVAALTPKPVTTTASKPKTFSQLRYRLEDMDIIGGSPVYDRRGQFQNLDAAFKDAAARAKAREGWPVLFADWQTPWQEVVKEKAPPQGNCVMVFEEIEAITAGEQTFQTIRDWRFQNSPPRDFIQSEIAL